MQFLGHTFAPTLLAALSWDPQIRGFLIVLTALLVLPGSVFLLLSTNTGHRLGFLLAVAGLSGWCLLMGIVWATFGIGLAGRPPSWKVQQIVQGDLARQSTVAIVNDKFPQGFTVMAVDDPKRGDALSSADKALVPDKSVVKEGEHAPAPAKFPPPFKDSSTDYVVTTVYEHRPAEFGKIHHHRNYLRFGFTSLHEPHYLVIEVQPALKLPDQGTGIQKPVADPTKQSVSVVLERDLGSLRFPPVMFALASGLVFGLTCWNLHRRDLEIMAARRSHGLATA